MHARSSRRTCIKSAERANEFFYWMYLKISNYISPSSMSLDATGSFLLGGLVELNTALPDPPSCFKLRAQRRRLPVRRRLVVGSPPASEGPPQAKLLAPAASSAKSASCNPSSPKQN